MLYNRNFKLQNVKRFYIKNKNIKFILIVYCLVSKLFTFTFLQFHIMFCTFYIDLFFFFCVTTKLHIDSNRLKRYQLWLFEKYTAEERCGLGLYTEPLIGTRNLNNNCYFHLLRNKLLMYVSKNVVRKHIRYRKHGCL